MSDTVDAAVKALAARLDGQRHRTARSSSSSPTRARCESTRAGSRPTTADADCTITADSATFQELLAGDLDPTAAFMSGRLSIEGDMGLAMRLASVLG